MNKGKNIEVLLIAGLILNAAAEFAELLPPEYSGRVTGLALAMWAVLRFWIRMQGAGEHVKEIEATRAQIDSDLKQVAAKRPL